MTRPVLIVDDHPINVMILSKIVGDIEDCEPVVFTVSEDALCWCADNDPVVVLIDYHMPTPNGIEFIVRFRELKGKKETPIVMITGTTDKELRYEALMKGANDFLNKPIDRTELTARLRNLLELAESRRRLADRAAWLADEVRTATAEIAAREQSMRALNAAYHRFVPHEFLSLLHKESVTEVVWGDQVQRGMTILVTDIRSFTTLAESMSPKETFNFLNSYLRRVGPIVREHGGFIDKYVGDGFMALFTSPDHALKAAIGLHAEVRLYNEHRASVGYAAIAIGIGIHTGTLTLGTIGESERMDTTAIGDAVNVAFRIEGLTKDYGALTVISEETLPGLERPADFNFRLLGSMPIKGRHREVTLYELSDCEAPEAAALKIRTAREFEHGVAAYSRGDHAEAAWAFKNVLAVNPDDRVAAFYLGRAALAPAAERARHGHGRYQHEAGGDELAQRD